MKIGVFSDTHSNIDALKKVFEEFERREVEKVICLGDTIGIGPYPRECETFLMEQYANRKFLSYIRGNHENYLLKGIPERNHFDEGAEPLSEEEKGTHRWNHANLTEEQKIFIQNLPNRDVIEVEGKKIVLEHYPMDEKGKFKTFHKLPTEEQLEKSFEIKDADIYLFGHTHVRCFYNENNKYFINPGSLGCPINVGGASCGILTIEDGNIDYEQLTVEYDIDKVIGEIKELNYPLNWFMIKVFYGKNIKDE